ncbi:MAG TPA: hypothetical protein VFX42_00925 [Gemmatimonadales bacterium]|nr:hypothetical protein [Gemmatimonadales bacterium]
MRLEGLRHVLGSGPEGAAVIGYIDFVKTGEHRISHEEVHESQSCR